MTFQENFFPGFLMIFHDRGNPVITTVLLSFSNFY